MQEILEDPDQNTSVEIDLNGVSPETAQSLSMLLPPQWAQGVRVFKITPTTHFCMGGVVVDSLGETCCQGLFAAGEVTAGAHGANRLGGNALAEVIAMGSLVGKATAEKGRDLSRMKGFDTAVQKEYNRLGAMFSKQGAMLREIILDLKQTMWVNAGIIRNQESLGRALVSLMNQKNLPVAVENPRDLIQFLEFRNMRLVGEMVCRSAMERTESRGSHFRNDYPAENENHWLANIQIRQTESDLVLEQVPVTTTL